MTPENKAALLWRGLNECRSADADLTVQTVTHWLEHHGAGLPDVGLFQERLREDARFWAFTATPQEREAYLTAALLELKRTALSERAAKRLAALVWQWMRPETRRAFLAWAQAQAAA